MGSAARNTAATTNQMSAATIADIRTRVYSGGKIYYNDINAIMTALEAYSGHTHSYFDQVTEYNYGNRSQGSTSATRTSGAAPGTNPGAVVGSLVSASDTNFINGYARTFQNHTHTHIAS
jgi:N-acetylneuraminic acid mutarotase